MLPRIRVLVYKEDSTVWYAPADAGESSEQIIGEVRTVSCNHQYLGICGLNMQAEQVPIPTSTIPPEAMSPPISNQGAQAIIAIGNVWVDTTFFGDSGFKVCVKVKDMETGIVSYIDASDYAANIPLCNLASYIVPVS